MRLVAIYAVIAALSLGCDLDSGKGGGGAGGAAGVGGAAGSGGASDAAIDSGSSATCDGTDVVVCGSNERCVVASQPLCGDPVPRTLCLPNVGCDLQFDPVCGCDGITYGNSCAATTSGIGIFHTGPCE